MARGLIIPRAAIAGVPIHALLVPFPVACFTGALLTDWVYTRSLQIQWSNFSAWLLAFGTFTGAIAALFGLIDFLGSPARPRPALGWFHLTGNIVVLLLALANDFVHARDAYSSVVPDGIILSAITVVLMFGTAFGGKLLAYRFVQGDRP
jgi:uncharacterized membrane protein